MKGLGITTDAASREAVFSVPRAVYSEAALTAAAQVFAARAEAYVSEDAAAWEVTLEARSPSGAAELEALAADFLVELLNQEARAAVSALNADIASLQLTQALLAARGGENPPPPPAEDPELRAEAERLMAAARAEAGKGSRR